MRKAGKYVLLCLTVLCLVFIFFNSLQNAASSSRQSGRLVTFVTNVIHSLTGKTAESGVVTHLIRKAAHFSEFALLGFLGTSTVAAFRHKVYGSVQQIAFWGLLAAVTDEFLQGFSAGRSPEVKDVFLDLAGFLTGLVLAWWITAALSRRRKTYEMGVSVD